MIGGRNLWRLCIGMGLLVVVIAATPGKAPQAADNTAKGEADCRALVNVPNLTILSAEIVPAKGSTPAYCHVYGLIAPAIHWHMQMPLPSQWNGRLLNIGNGGKAGNLVYSDGRLAEGYAVANSNTGHDNGAEPDASFGLSRQELIDFGYRATHLTTNASKTLTKVYYGKDPKYAYFEGCSTGGKQAMMEAQRFPYDFDGIVAGDGVIEYQRINVAHVWDLQRQMKEHFAGSLAFDTKNDGTYPSLAKLEILRKAVLDKCDAKDGIKDGIIDDPTKCDFEPEADLANKMCPGNKNADNCFTDMQIQTIKALYAGPHDSKGNPILKGLAKGSEYNWPDYVIPYAGNNFSPQHMRVASDHLNYLFFADSPGMAPLDRTKLSSRLDKKAALPEWAWWDFNVDDVTSGKGDAMMKITDSTDPDLARFISHGKLIVYEGWYDSAVYPEVISDYYKKMVTTTFKGDYKAAQQKAALFMVPGMGHCSGGPGPNEWDKLAPLVQWVENGKAPDYIVAVHRAQTAQGSTTRGPVDDERKVCAYPGHAVYTGPAGQQNDPKNWVQANFACKAS